MKKVPFLFKSLVQISLPVASFTRNAIKYGTVVGAFKWFVYLTNWKGCALFLEGALDLSRLLRIGKVNQIEIESPHSEQKNSKSEPLTQDTNALDESIDQDLVDARQTMISNKEIAARILVLQLTLTADLLYWLLDRSHDDGFFPTLFSYMLHSVDALAMLATYIYCNTPLQTTGSKLERILLEIVPILTTLMTYGWVFYLPYQIKGGTAADGTVPYTILNWLTDPAIAAVCTGVLPLAMPTVNAGIIAMTKKAQHKSHIPALESETSSMNSKLSFLCCKRFTAETINDEQPPSPSLN